MNECIKNLSWLIDQSRGKIYRERRVRVMRAGLIEENQLDQIISCTQMVYTHMIGVQSTLTVKMNYEFNRNYEKKIYI